ncbi:MAG: cation diffusion facilitator family transporter [Bacilli bacterium]|nr:cation diffusion facilitator family transporter [Bacilli bacterium]
MNRIFKTLVVSLVTNLTLVIFKIIFGIIGHSRALIVDGVHSFSDLITDMVAMAGDRISRVPADKEHPYGHGKAEYITSLFIGSIIFLLGLSLIIDTILKPSYIPDNAVVIVIVSTIIAKYLLARYIIRIGKLEKNNILISSGQESYTDVLSSLVVLVSFILSKFNKYHIIFTYSDKVGGIIISVLILRVGFRIIKENTNALMDEKVNDKQFLIRVNRLIKKCKEVKKVDSIHIIKNGHYYKVNIQISVDRDLTLLESHDIAHKVEDYLKSKINNMKYIDIHVNPYIEE